MSILAEPRRKQRLSIDPQNLQWKNDERKFSRKLMEKMGWSEGEGLGRNRQGTADHVKLKANYSGRGLGADKLASYDNTWIGHHDDFADLLSALNKNKGREPATEEEKLEKAEKISLELSSKSLRRRIHYQKFTRAKDISNYTDNDRTAVLGLGRGRAKHESPKKEEPKIELAQEEAKSKDQSKSNTTVSAMSVGEYFASKMAALKAKTEQIESVTKVDIDVMFEEGIVKKEIVNEEIEEERKGRKKKRKEMKKLQESLKHEIPTEPCEVKVEVVEDEEAERKRRKREKKLKRRFEQEQERVEEDSRRAKIEAECTEKERAEPPLRKEQKKKDKQHTEGVDETMMNERMDIKKKKKKNRKIDTVKH